jgi:hypothetical protein
MSTELTHIANRLNEISRTAFVALPVITEWPETLDSSDWMISPELVSLYGSPEWQQMDEARQKQLAFHELVNFFSLNIHGERFLLAGLASQLYGKSHTPSYVYLHHFIDEENKHLHYFGGFCSRYARIYPDRKINLSLTREYAPGEADLLFFARILIFEEIVDYYNIKVAKDPCVHPLIRKINSLHHQDEVRHLAFGRSIVRELAEKFMPSWSPEAVERFQHYMGQYILTTWREYCNPDVYADAGFDDPYDTADKAYQNARPTHLNAAKRVAGYLQELNLLTPDFLEAAR